MVMAIPLDKVDRRVRLLLVKRPPFGLQAMYDDLIPSPDPAAHRDAAVTDLLVICQDPVVS